MKIKPVTFKLILMLFLEFAVWGAYLTSLGRYLGNIGLGSQIKWFFAMQTLAVSTKFSSSSSAALPCS